MNRYYLQAGAWDENTLTLTGEEAHHATRVMRVAVDEEVEIFDGHGKSAVCRVSQATKSAVECSIKSTAPKLYPNTRLPSARQSLKAEIWNSSCKNP